MPYKEQLGKVTESVRITQEAEEERKTWTGSSQPRDQTSPVISTGRQGELVQDQLMNILQEMGIPDHLTCLLNNLYAGQEATVRTGHGTTDQFQIGTGVRQGCILSPCLFSLYAEYIMRNTGLEEAQAGIKIAGRNINNLRYADAAAPEKPRDSPDIAR